MFVAFPGQFGYHRQRLSEKRSIDLVSGVASGILGRKVSVRLEAAKKGGRPGAAAGANGSSGENNEASTPARAREAASRDPKIRKLVDKSSGRIERVGDR